MSAPLGDLDELVLLTVGILHPEAYAYAIKEKIRAETGHRPALPTIHTALYRLEERGMLRSEMGGATTQRGGRRKRLFSLTHAGLAALSEVRTTRDRMWGLIPIQIMNVCIFSLLREALIHPDCCLRCISTSPNSYGNLQTNSLAWNANTVMTPWQHA